MMSWSPWVVDMEYRETTWPTMSNSTNIDPPRHHSSRFITSVSTTSAGFQKTLGLSPWGTSQGLWWVSFNIWGIWFCCIYYSFGLCNFCLDIMLFAPFHFGGWHCALVSGSASGIGLLLGGPLDKSTYLSWPYLSLSTLHPLISLPFGILGVLTQEGVVPHFMGRRG